MKRNAQAGAARNAGLRFEVLSQTDLDDVHLATLEVLERPGCSSRTTNRGPSSPTAEASWIEAGTS